MEKIPVLIVSSRMEDVVELNELFQQTPWELTVVERLEDAATALKSADVPMLLLDCETAGAAWQATLKRLAHTRRSACVVMLSGIADQHLWDKVIHHGGFDLLTRPFRREQVLSMLVFAYAHCRTPWSKRAVS